MANLEGKVAVVTGAGRGIGRAIALCFARAGADIAICARSGDDLREVSTDIQAMGRNCLVMAFDISNPDEVRIFCDKIISEFGKVDILVNNAGAYLERGAFIDSDPELWWKTIEVNLRGPFLVCRHLAGAMKNNAKIINLTSGKGFAAGANSSAYHVSKAALNMLTESLANELWEFGVEVNSLVPGPTATTTFDNKPAGQERSAEAILSAEKETLPKGLPRWERVKHPDEVAEFALSLASYPPGGPTGQVFSLARRPL